MTIRINVYGRCQRDRRRCDRVQADLATPLLGCGSCCHSKLSYGTVLLRLLLVAMPLMLGLGPWLTLLVWGVLLWQAYATTWLFDDEDKQTLREGLVVKLFDGVRNSDSPGF